MLWTSGTGDDLRSTRNHSEPRERRFSSDATLRTATQRQPVTKVLAVSPLLVIILVLAAVALLIAGVALFRTTSSHADGSQELAAGDEGKGLVDVAGPLGFLALLFRRRQPSQDAESDTRRRT